MKPLVFAALGLLLPLSALADSRYSAFKMKEVKAGSYELPIEDGWPFSDTKLWAMTGIPPKTGSFVASMTIDGKPVCRITIDAKIKRDKPVKCDTPAQIACGQKVAIAISGIKGKPSHSGVAFIYDTEHKMCGERENI